MNRFGNTTPPDPYGRRDPGNQAIRAKRNHMTLSLRIGIATPMANPTVEPELRALFPADVNMLVTRSVAEGNSKSRLIGYFERLPEALHSFGGMDLHAFGFACTASSYLLAPGVEADTSRRLTEDVGYRVITASQAIEQALRSRGVERLAIASPYPPWIAEACVAFWTGRGFDVVASTSSGRDMADTRAIYALDAETACQGFIRELDPVDADALLVTGTGMPTLDLLRPLEAALGLPTVSSNSCLAQACLDAARMD